MNQYHYHYVLDDSHQHTELARMLHHSIATPDAWSGSLHNPLEAGRRIRRRDETRGPHVARGYRCGRLSADNGVCWWADSANDRSKVLELFLKLICLI